MEQNRIQSLTDAVIRRIFIPLEASARHVHLSQEQCLMLFGCPLTPERPLSQPGQFLSKQRLTIIGPKGKFDHVAVLGPARPEAQVEVSITDSRTLGIVPPVRQSGHVENTPGIILQTPRARLTLSHGTIIAQRHLHLTPEDAARFGVRDRQIVCLQTMTVRPVLYQDVVVRVSANYATAAHLDFDEANACGMKNGDLGRIIL